MSIAEKESDDFSRQTAKVSAAGIAIGYSYGLVFLGLSQVPAQVLKGSYGMRVAIGCSGIQLACLAAIAYSKEYRPIPQHSLQRTFDVYAAWKDLYKLVKRATQLKETFKFLIYWMIVSDGLATISSAAILFAKTALHMGTGQIIVVGILVPICSLLSSVLWPKFATRFNYDSHYMLVLMTAMTALIPLYACLGFIPGTLCDPAMISVFAKKGIPSRSRSWRFWILYVFDGDVCSIRVLRCLSD